MQTYSVDFAGFNKTWNNVDGYLPVYVYGDDEFNEEGKVRILLDMVAPSRLHDGKICMLAVKLTEDELPAFQRYLEMVGDHWKKVIAPSTEDLLMYTNNFKEE